ncbi:acyl-coenzyme A thioesterase PaaI-like protein [Bradyrhizobium liaoningense]
MTPLEKLKAMKMPFAELKGVEFVEAEKDRVVARMTVRARSLHASPHHPWRGSDGAGRFRRRGGDRDQPA